MAFSSSGLFSNTTNSKTLSILAAVIIIGTSFAMSQVISSDPRIAIYILAGIIIFIFAFMSTDFALAMLLLSMLLSPEFGSGGGDEFAEKRQVVVRIDDILLGVITLSWLVKTALHKEIGIFVKTPLNKPIFAYILASLFSTILGVFTGNVNLLL